MSLWRASLVFRNSVGAASTSGSLFGWTESWYYGIDFSPEGIRAAGLRLANARRKLLSPGWRIERVRYAVYPSTRIAFAPAIPPPGGDGEYTLWAGRQDEQAYDKLVNAALCVSGRGKSYDLGGIGSDVVDPGGVFVNPAGWVGVYNQWDAELASGWAVRRRVRGTVYPIEVVSITPADVRGGLTPNPHSPVLGLPGAADVPAVGSVIRVTGANGLAYLSGEWRVSQHGAGGAFQYFQLAAKRGTRVVGAYEGGGSLWGYTYELDRYLSGTPVRGTSRRTGGPSGRPRGRRSTRRS